MDTGYGSVVVVMREWMGGEDVEGGRWTPTMQLTASHS